MEKNEMSKEEFAKLLEDHDWFYNMSDDPWVWTRGNQERLKIENLCKENPEFQKMYEEKGNSIFNPQI